MKFEMNVGTDYSTVKFIGDIISFRPCVSKSFIASFNRLGGILQDDGQFKFPVCVNSQVLEQVIRNTCFVCGGLMKDGVAMVDQAFEFEHDVYGTVTQQVPSYAKQIKVRKCTSCGHSHT